MRGRAFPADVREEALRATDAGERQRDVANRLGIARGTIGHWRYRRKKRNPGAGVSRREIVRMVLEACCDGAIDVDRAADLVMAATRVRS